MSGNTIFQSLVEGRGRCGTNWPTEVVKIAARNEFDENSRFFNTSCGPYVGQTFRLFFTHLTIKRTQRMAFKNNVSGNNKIIQNALGIALFIFILFFYFLRNFAFKLYNLYMVTAVGIRVKEHKFLLVK
jgi:hypothetical protein